ncbi:hypothetical protein Ddye_010410 [Dipteronia dyeriana]|uniref:TF-B3 domain-containing protein n=1 Tax=Dipteronia dyeriana TaxID=168575 RepID=A0AAE0CNT2_9ROSI|nr:hypothetical protein Ddye_010410 [Dipteronia dyeriana]
MMINFSNFIIVKVIPPAFVRHLNERIPKDVILEDNAGRQWHCRLEEAEGGQLAITNGWKSFAIQHSLETGDFLTFKYNNTHSIFTVNVFGRNGCIKEDKLDVIRVKKEKETEEEHTSGAPDHAREKYSEIVLRRTNKSGTVVQRKKRKNAAYVVPKNPYFVATIGSKYSMYVSGYVVKLNSIELNTEMTLHDEKGKKWPVKVAWGKDGRVNISKGWVNFYNNYNLNVGDKCLFEFICTRGKKCNEMKVQVITRVHRSDQNSLMLQKGT